MQKIKKVFCLVMLVCIPCLNQAKEYQIKQGVVITRENHGKYLSELKKLLFTANFVEVTNGLKEGWITLPIKREGNTIKAPSNFARWSESNIGKCKIGPGNELIGWKAGAPFPHPKTGAELAQNIERAHQGCQQYKHDFNFLLIDKKGGLERSFKMRCYGRFWRGRTELPPIPEVPGNNGVIRLKESIFIFEPFDVKGFTQIRIRYEDIKREDDAYGYIPAIRRVRRLTGADVTDPILGSDMVNDDFECWRQKINSKMTFHLTEPKEFLVPVFYRKAPREFKGNCSQIDWQIRLLWTLEVFTNDPDYCYSKRVIYVDPEGGMANLWGAEMYDQRGRLWRGVSQIIHRIDTKTNLIGGLWFQACVDDHLSGHSSLLQMSPSGNNDPSVTYEKFTIKCLLREAR